MVITIFFSFYSIFFITIAINLNSNSDVPCNFQVLINKLNFFYNWKQHVIPFVHATIDNF